MDDALKVAIAGTMKRLGEIPENQMSWENVVGAMMQNPFIEPIGEGTYRSDEILKGGSSFFTITSSPELPIVKEVSDLDIALISSLFPLRDEGMLFTALNRLNHGSRS